MNTTLGRLLIPNGIYLGKEELSRQQLFLIDKLKTLISLGGCGIVGTDSFVVTPGVTGAGTINVSNSLAFDINGEFIHKESQSGILIPEGSYWLVCRFIETPLEKGVCSVTSVNGVYTVTGIGTEFTKLARGLSQNYKPVKIEFEKQNLSETNLLQNQGRYTVLEVISDTQMTLADPVYGDTNVKVKVVGTFNQDLIPSTDDRFPYKNCGCELILVPELVVGQKPSLSSYGVDGETVFPIASIFNSSGTVTVIDRREDFYTELKEFVSETQWETVTLKAGFFSDPTFPIKVRLNHFKNQLEIFGKFSSTMASGVILQLPSEYWPQNPCILKMIKEDTKEEIPLSLSMEGSLELYDSTKAYTIAGTNFIYNQIITLY